MSQQQIAGGGSHVASSTARSVAGPLEPATQAFVDSLAGGKPIYTLSPEAARDVLAGAQKSVSVTLAPASAEDRVLSVGPKGRINIRVYRPENAEGTLPVNDTLTRRVRPGS